MLLYLFRCKLAALYFHRERFCELLNKLFNHYSKGEYKLKLENPIDNIDDIFIFHLKDYNKEEIAIYRKVIISTTFAMTLLASGGLLTCSMYVFSPIISNLYYYFIDQPLVKEQPFNAV